jgi:hypothetical protein
MTNYNGIPCPVCKKDFTEKDTARPVICPDCGAPYHLDCYKSLGNCAFADRHKNGFVWAVPAPSESKNKPETLEEGFYSEIRRTLDMIGWFERVEPSEDEQMIFGVSEKELANFHDTPGGTKSMRFIKYRQIAMGKKVSFNIMAGFFSPYYMFFMRMRAVGIIFALIDFLLGLPFMADPMLLFGDEGLAQTAITLAYVNMGLRIAVALFFDYFYLRWSAYKIKQIRSSFIRATVPNVTPDMTFKLSDLGDDYYQVLQKLGKPDMICMLRDSVFVYIALRLISNFFI